MNRLNIGPSTKRQRGIATILVVVLVGLALTATSFGLVHSVRLGQEKQVASHAAIHAQNGVWVGVDAFRGYLAQLEPDDVQNLAGNFTVDFAGANYGSISVSNIAVTQNGSTYRVSADITNIHAAAKSSATIGAVFEVTFQAASCEDCVVLETALDFHDDLNVGGDITFVPVPGTKNRINVDGDVSMLSINVNNVHDIYATGSVELNSAVNIEKVFSNEDVTIGGGAWADLVRTRGNAITADGAGIGVVWANGDVTLGGSRRSENVNAIGSASVTATAMGSHGDFSLGGSFNIAGFGPMTVDAVTSVGNVSVVDEDIHMTDIVSEGNLNCPTISWSDYGSISLNGVLNPGCTVVAADLVNVRVAQNNTVNVMDPIAEITIPRFVVDVWTLKQYAHYAFEWDSAANATKVSIQNINGIPDGDYYIGDYSGPVKSRICNSVDGSGNCTSPASPGHGAICLGHSTYNSCLSYDSATSKWTFNGTSAAPGIMWFDGNVLLDNGYNYTTILATLNVSTGGQFRGVSVNYGGYDEICDADGSSVAGHLRSEYQGLFSSRYPTDLCVKSTSEFTPNLTGNIGIAAGGYNPSNGGAYSGGEISLASNNEVWGAVLAGSYLHTHGQTVVYGYVTAAAGGTKGSDDNSLGGNTTIDLTKATDDYNPAYVPDMTGGACPDCDNMGGAGGDPAGTTLLWSRYR